MTDGYRTGQRRRGLELELGGGRRHVCVKLPRPTNGTCLLGDENGEAPAANGATPYGRKLNPRHPLYACLAAGYCWRVP
eukprot:scaffold7863_cov277-Pinguiococcus_pyrenoidosus.AAC.7